MDIYKQIGKIAIGSRLRRLSETIAGEASKIYSMYGIDMQPKWFPVFYVLSKEKEKMISEIATDIGHSQPSVSKIVREMVKNGIVKETKGGRDKRKSMISLTDLGNEIIEKIEFQYKDINAAIEKLLSETNSDLWQAIEEWEYLLSQQSLHTRVKEEKRKREFSEIEIIEYSDKYRQDFKNLNVEWISKYFKMEDSDYKALDNPKAYILDNGGFIFVALYNQKPVGVCALLKMKDERFDFELAKMAVSPDAQGKNIGYYLGRAAIKKAKETGATSIYLESNTLLQPAINLYHKLGFSKITGIPSPYERCNIQMSLNLNNTKMDL